MILVDTSIWIDHLHRADPGLTAALEADDVGSHPLVVEELALGSIRQRAEVIETLQLLDRFPVLDHDELLSLVDAHRLWGRGLSAVDAHLLGSALMSPGGELWTRDKRLLSAAKDVGAARY